MLDMGQLHYHHRLFSGTTALYAAIFIDVGICGANQFRRLN